MLRDQRERGRRAILDTIRKAGKVARIDIAELTEISQATVTTITAELLADGLIEEVIPDHASDAKRGRPRVDLKLRGEAHMVAGVKVASNGISVALVNFEGQMLHGRDIPLEKEGLEPKVLAEKIRKGIEAACASHGCAFNALSAVGIGISGIVDAQLGFVHWSPLLSRHNVKFSEILAETLGKPVIIDNDANLVAMAELYFGLGKGVEDFLVVTIENGVGMGIVLGGELYRGTRGCGAEFGHTKVQLDGALCRCGQRGCLEAYISDYALLREASLSKAFSPDDTPDEQIKSLLQAARDGEVLPQKIVTHARQMLAMGLANLVNIFDPQLIILSGERMQIDHLYAQDVIDSIRDSIVHIDVLPPTIEIHRWGDSMWAQGAAAFALEKVVDMSLKELNESVA